MKSSILILAIMISFISCCRKVQQNTTPVTGSVPTYDSLDFIGPPTIIYKTNKDYYDKVPVTLSEDKSKVISYPDIKDVYYEGQLSLPTRMSNGYLLDNRGISQNVAFISMTYQEYAALDKTPDPDELMKYIIDDEPIAEMYNCGNRYQFTSGVVTEVNTIIGTGKLGSCKKMK